MRTARAVELGLCIGLLVGAAAGFAAGVGLVVKKPARFGLSDNASPPPGTYQSAQPKSSDGPASSAPMAAPNGSTGAGSTGIGKVGGDTSEDRVPHSP